MRALRSLIIGVVLCVALMAAMGDCVIAGEWWLSNNEIPDSDKDNNPNYHIDRNLAKENYHTDQNYLRERYAAEMHYMQQRNASSHEMRREADQYTESQMQNDLRYQRELNAIDNYYGSGF